MQHVSTQSGNQVKGQGGQLHIITVTIAYIITQLYQLS
jgi:hypothetical protein